MKSAFAGGTAELVGDNLVITIPYEAAPSVPSKSGKTLRVASSEGLVTTGLLVAGKPVVIGLNAFVK